MPRGRAAVLCAGLAVLALGAPLAPARAAEDVPVLVIDGSGWGHGVGMAQDGALAMGRQGASLGQILGQFYPGTTIGQARGDVRVPVLSAGSAPTSATITFPDGGQLVDTLTGQQSPGFPRPVPAGGTVVITWDGHVYSATTPAGVTAAAEATPVAAGPPSTLPGLLGRLLTPPTTPPTTRPPTHPGANQGPTTTRAASTHVAPSTTAPGATTTTSPSTTTGPGAPGTEPPVSSTRPLWAIPSGGGALGVPGRGREYRGDIEADGSTGALRLVNQLDVETYLTGMGEVIDPSWPAASLEAQEVAARTYAMRAMATSGELCDDTRCQVYLGTAGEYPAGQRAVAATAGQVLVAGGQLADAVYSANAAGFSASREEGFGVPDAGYPYLRAAPYPAGPPLTWSVSVAVAAAGARLGLSGPVSAAAVTAKGPSGRALQVTLTAAGVQHTVSGLAFAAALGLRSTMISVRVGSASSAPPVPVAVDFLQALPESVGAIAPVAVRPPIEVPARSGVPIHRGTGNDRGLSPALVALAVLLLALTAGGTVRLRHGAAPRPEA